MTNRLEIMIRPARLEDTPDVLELTRRIWDGDDYVPQVWEKWLHDPLGCLLVAEYQGRIVGLAKLSETTPEDWWMQGLRVHPEFEGFGIASRLHEAILDYWQEHGRGAVRLTTHFERFQVHHLCQRTGFLKVGEYSYFQAPALNDAAADFTPVTLEEAGEALEYALNSPLEELTLAYMDVGWEWMPPHPGIMREIIQRGQALWWKDHQGLLLFGVETEEDERDAIPYIVRVACPPPKLVDLLSDYRRLAGQLGFANAGWSPPLLDSLLPILLSAGFERKWDGAVVLFEKSKGI